ncbi:MAG: Holliday junction resolvase RuvX [Nevskiales bacterium]
MTAARKQKLGKSGIVLGFDYGSKRIGVAVGNQLLCSARPLRTLANRDPWPALRMLIREWQPDALIVGRPLASDGGRQPMLEATERFMSELKQHFKLPVHSVDERYSSLAAQSELKSRRAAGRLRRPKAGERDMQAAQIILQDWMRQFYG